MTKGEKHKALDVLLHQAGFCFDHQMLCTNYGELVPYGGTIIEEFFTTRKRKGVTPQGTIRKLCLALESRTVG